ncbi:hypothetical protein SO802_018073 [Lithocarpus litseifolius]|uniref:Uncharacterized protein n=1 Tax=Lithocarpus litseifolius TaxID=425828 RepID=A0AAW2CN69_9ROSI
MLLPNPSVKLRWFWREPACFIGIGLGLKKLRVFEEQEPCCGYLEVDLGLDLVDLRWVGGFQGVGEVYSVGSAVKGLLSGDWVVQSPTLPSSGTWQTYVVKDQSVWHKINKDSPRDYAATIAINPLTALRMLEDFITLNPGTDIS